MHDVVRIDINIAFLLVLHPIVAFSFRWIRYYDAAPLGRKECIDAIVAGLFSFGRVNMQRTAIARRNVDDQMNCWIFQN